jgi:hypothetical protein
MPADFQYSPADQEELAAAFARLADGEEFALGVPTTSQQSGDEEEEVPDGEEDDDSEHEDSGDEEESETGDEEEGDDDAPIDLGNGTHLTRAEILELARLRDHFAANPEVAQRLDEAQSFVPRQQPQPVAAAPTYSPPTPPEDLDLDDPAVKFLWEQQQALQQQVFYQNQELIRRQQVEQGADIERAVTNWNTQYHLDDAAISDIRVRAAKLNVLGNMIANGISVYDATVNVLEAAFWGDPTYRDQYLRAQAQDNKDNERTQRSKNKKLGALAGRGTTTSNPKPPSEMSKSERNEAMIAEIADHLARN